MNLEQKDLEDDITGALFDMAKAGHLKSLCIDVEHDFGPIGQIGQSPALLGARIMVSTPDKLSVGAIAKALLKAGWNKRPA